MGTSPLGMVRFTVERNEEGESLRLALYGELDLYGAPRFDDELVRAEGEMWPELVTAEAPSAASSTSPAWTASRQAPGLRGRAWRREGGSCRADASVRRPRRGAGR